MINENFVIVGTIIAGIGTLSYLVDTVRGRVKPNRVSFLMWSIAPLIAFVAQLKQGVGIQSLMTFSVGFFPLIILIASFVNKKAQWKLTRFDLICGLLSLAGLVLWLITRVGNVAIFFSIMADGLAALPTIVKSYKFPETESAWPWSTAAISGILTLLTITNWSFANYGFPLYISTVNSLIFVLAQFQLGKKIKSILVRYIE